MSTSTPSSPIPVDSPGTVCSACQVRNSPQRKFCHECGQRLWEPCAACQTANAVDATFCGNCGTRLTDAFQTLENEIDNQSNRAKKLMAEGRFFEAQTHLRSIPASSDSRLQKRLADLQTLANSMQAMREQESSKAESAHQAALEHLLAQRWAEAREAMAAIPLGLLTASMKETIAQLDTVWQEIQTLRQQIRSALQSKQTDHLLPQVVRLLHLQPSDPSIKRLADELSRRQALQLASETTRAIREAQSLFQQQKYPAARERVADVDASQVTDDLLRQILRKIQDVGCAIEILKSEPFTLPEMMAVTQCWLQACPQDPQAQRLSQTLQSRLRTAGAAESGLPWIKIAPEKVPSRVTEWWRLPPKAFWPEEHDELLERPGAFFSAYGLALQGLGVAPLSLDLLPVSKSFIGKWMPAPKASATTSDTWGLDVGDTGLKAVHLTRDKKSPEIIVHDAIFVAHEQPLSEVSDDAALQATIKATLTSFIERTGKANFAAVVGFPGTQSLGRWFDLPPLKPNKLAEAIGYEARMQIPIPVEEIEYDWHAWSTSGLSSNFQPVTLLAARRDQIATWMAPFREAGVRPIGLQSSSLAFFNAGNYFKKVLTSERAVAPASANGSQEPESFETVGWLDLGADSTTLVLSNGRQLRFRTLSTGIRKMDRALMDQCRLTASQAEHARQLKSPSVALHEVHTIIDSAIEEILRPIYRSIRSFEGEGWRLDRLIVGGGGANQLGVLRHLVHHT